MAKQQNLHQKITRLENRIMEMEKVIRPIVLEKEAKEESKNITIISCDASWENGLGSSGVIIRGPGIMEPYKFKKVVPCKTSNEAELDAIWNGLDTYICMFANSSKKLFPIEIRSDSKHCINLLNGKGKPRELTNKINHIKNTRDSFNNIWSDNLIKFIWRKRNSTFDLTWADNLSKGN